MPEVKTMTDTVQRFICRECSGQFWINQRHFKLGPYMGLCESCFRRLPPAPLRTAVAEAFETAEALDKPPADWAGLPPAEMPGSDGGLPND